MDGGADGGNLARQPEVFQQIVIAATAGNVALYAHIVLFDLENEAGVIFHLATKVGGELGLGQIDFIFAHPVDALLVTIERLADVEPVIRGKVCKAAPTAFGGAEISR